MGDEMKRIALMGIMILIASQAYAVQYRLNSEFSFIEDTDYEKQRLFALGADAIFDRKSDDRVAVKAGTHTFTHRGDDEDFDLLSASGGKSFGRNVRLEGNVAFYHSPDWSPVLYGGSLIAAPGPFRFELSGSRELVDSLTAVRNHYLVHTAGISADYSITDEITIVGAYFHQHITDGNDRDGEIGKIIYSPGRYEWLKLAASIKHLEGEFIGIGYYSPTELTEYMGIVTLVRSFFNDRFSGRVNGGLGQRHDDDGTKLAALVNGRLRGWFNDSFGIDASVGYANDSGSFGQYARYYLSVVLIYAFP